MAIGWASTPLPFGRNIYGQALEGSSGTFELGRFRRRRPDRTSQPHHARTSAQSRRGGQGGRRLLLEPATRSSGGESCRSGAASAEKDNRATRLWSPLRQLSDA